VAVAVEVQVEIVNVVLVAEVLELALGFFH
jgi:hypothetical protein